MLAYVFFVSFKDTESFITQLSKTPATIKSHDSEQAIHLLEAGMKGAVTPLDINRFQSKAFQAVISHHTGKTTPVAHGGPLQKEPSLNLDTPSKFLSNDKLFKPSFDVKVIFANFLICGPVLFKIWINLKQHRNLCFYLFLCCSHTDFPFWIKPGRLFPLFI